MNDLSNVRDRYESYKQLGLQLNMTRGQPADANFDLSNPLFSIMDSEDYKTPSGIDVRNYPGGIAGLPEARELLCSILRVRPDEMIVGNNSSLHLMSDTLMWGLLKGLVNSPHPWIQDNPKMIITVPGYDRHFSLIEALGYELVPVNMTGEGPDVEAVAELAAADPSVKGIFFVPQYSNPTSETISLKAAHRLVSLEAAAPDFTVFADDAYCMHHLVDDPEPAPNLLRLAEVAGRPNRVILFGSTSKITFAGAGIGIMAASVETIGYLKKLLGLQAITPNKIEQYRHVRFLSKYPGGIQGLMRDHARVLRPKFEAVQRVLEEELGGTGLATWTNPTGGYFVSMMTTKPVADRVVALAKDAGVALTPAGATYPGFVDPENRNIRLAPSRPPLAEVEQAMRIVAICMRIASEETK